MAIPSYLSPLSCAIMQSMYWFSNLTGNKRRCRHAGFLELPPFRNVDSIEHYSRIHYHRFQGRQEKYSNWLTSENWFSVSNAVASGICICWKDKVKRLSLKKGGMWLQSLSQLIHTGILRNCVGSSEECTTFDLPDKWDNRSLAHWLGFEVEWFRPVAVGRSGPLQMPSSLNDSLFIKNAMVLDSSGCNYCAMTPSTITCPYLEQLSRWAPYLHSKYMAILSC